MLYLFIYLLPLQKGNKGQATKENKKVNKQTVILKGIHATPEGEKVIREYEKEGVQNGVYRVSKIED